MYLKTLNLGDIRPYERNPRINDKAVEPVMKSIQKDGYRARIIVDKDGVIIAGHTRYEAMKRLGWTEAEVWIADDMTPEQIADYRIRDNLTADFAEWDFSELEAEIAEMDLDFDMSEFDGFEDIETADDDEQDRRDVYTGKVDVPQYQPTGKEVNIDQMYDSSKYEELLQRIEQSDVTVDEKVFLKLAATRHIVFDYTNIAEYYANANAEMQKLMEESALVIIDLDDAIKQGYATFAEKIERLADANG